MTTLPVIVSFVVGAALIGFSAGLMTARGALWLGDWVTRRRRRRKASGRQLGELLIMSARLDGKTDRLLQAYQDEVALMARSDAGKTANVMASMLQARVAMRMAEGNHHG